MYVLGFFLYSALFFNAVTGTSVACRVTQLVVLVTVYITFQSINFMFEVIRY